MRDDSALVHVIPRHQFSLGFGGRKKKPWIVCCKSPMPFDAHTCAEAIALPIACTLLTIVAAILPVRPESALRLSAML